MLPDLRFFLGAVVAAALLAIAALGIGTAVHLSHQPKVGPLEASRTLAYIPPGAASAGEDDPFAKVPPAGLRPPDGQRTAEIEGNTAGSEREAAMPAADPVAAADSADDHDAVDERAVVDPPLLENDTTEAAAADPRSEQQVDTAPAIRSAEQPATAPQTATAAPQTAPLHTVQVAPLAEPEQGAPAPVATPAAEPAPAPAIAEAPTAAPVDDEPVGSLPPVAAAEAKQKPAKAKNRRPQSEQHPKAANQKVAARPTPKARSRQLQSTASTGYAVGSSNAVQPFGLLPFGAPANATSRPSKPLWSSATD